MQNNLPATIETAEQAVEEANRVIQVELVPLAVDLLRKMLAEAKLLPVGKKIDPDFKGNYGRYHLELVKLAFSSGGVGRSSQAKGKDPAKMTAQELANLLDGARIINHAPAKSLALDD